MRARVVTRTRSAGASAASATELWVFATPDATVYAIYAPGFDDALTVLNGVLIRDGWAPYLWVLRRPRCTKTRVAHGHRYWEHLRGDHPDRTCAVELEAVL